MQSRVSSLTLRSWIATCYLLTHDSHPWHRTLVFLTIVFLRRLVSRFHVACSNLHRRNFEPRSKELRLGFLHGVFHRGFTISDLCNPSVSPENLLPRFNDSMLLSSNSAAEKWHQKMDESRTELMLSG